jgi:lipopolysaccharide biosynthesis glycosyltransferase
MTLPVFIGYDSREHEAYEVCRASLLRHASQPLHIVRLDQSALRSAGIYNRDWRQEGRNRIDLGDLKPFSTDFAFTRFLVPALSMYQGWALFCDCDFLFTEDVAELFGRADPNCAVMCVKHHHEPVEQEKMGGIVQGRYFRKNWSSLVLWNCAHPANRSLTVCSINKFAGAWLHAFSWLADEDIGALPQRWNWLAGVDAEVGETPSGIHYTLGIPIMPGCENTPYADLWRAAFADIPAANPKEITA